MACFSSTSPTALRVPSILHVERRAATALASERHPPVGEDGVAY